MNQLFFLDLQLGASITEGFWFWHGKSDLEGRSQSWLPLKQPTYNITSIYEAEGGIANSCYKKKYKK